MQVKPVPLSNRTLVGLTILSVVIVMRVTGLATHAEPIQPSVCARLM
jgi:hypothetical protein